MDDSQTDKAIEQDAYDDEFKEKMVELMAQYGYEHCAVVATKSIDGTIGHTYKLSAECSYDFLAIAVIGLSAIVPEEIWERLGDWEGAVRLQDAPQALSEIWSGVLEK